VIFCIISIKLTCEFNNFAAKELVRFRKALLSKYGSAEPSCGTTPQKVANTRYPATYQVIQLSHLQ
jgi:hypothetical protein